MNTPELPLGLTASRAPAESTFTPPPRTTAPGPSGIATPLRRSPPLTAAARLAARAATLRTWLVTELFASAFRPLVATVTVWRWADAHVMLHAAGTGRGGPYNSARTPWVREFMETFTDPLWREDHVMKCSRSGYTEGALNIIRFMPEHAPGPAHLALDSAKAATDVNKERLEPTLRRSLAPGEYDLLDDDDKTSRVIRLRNMVIRVTGSYTEGAFRQHGNRVVILDEVEVVNEIAGVGTLHDLGRSRIRGVDGAALFSMSKPVKWGSAHHHEVVSGTLSFNALPCPHCGAYQELTVDGRSLVDQIRIEKSKFPGQPPPSPKLEHSGAQLGRLDFSHCKLLDGSWDLERIERETVYQCVSGCRIEQDAPLPPAVVALVLAGDDAIAAALKSQISDLTSNDSESLSPQISALRTAAAAHSLSDEVRTLLRGGRHFTCKQAMTLSGAAHWIKTNPRHVPRKRSRHISDLHSLDDDMTWGIFARGWVVAQGDPAKVQTYLNEHFGLPSRVAAAEITEEQILELRSAYARGTLPFRPDVIVTGADTQDSHWVDVTVAARLDSAGKNYSEIAVIDWGMATTKAELIARLAVPLTYTPPTGPQEIFHSIGGLVDAGGHRKDEVYELHFESGFRYFACYGRGGVAIVTPTWEREIEWRETQLKIYFFHDAAWKKRLYLGSIAKNRAIKECLAKGYDPEARQLQPLLRTPGQPQDRMLALFESELQGERLNDKGEWEVIPGTQNHYGDALKMARVTLELKLPLLIAERARAEAEAAKAKPTKPA